MQIFVDTLRASIHACVRASTGELAFMRVCGLNVSIAMQVTYGVAAGRST